MFIIIIIMRNRGGGIIITHATPPSVQGGSPRLVYTLTFGAQVSSRVRTQLQKEGTNTVTSAATD